MDTRTSKTARVIGAVALMAAVGLSGCSGAETDSMGDDGTPEDYRADTGGSGGPGHGGGGRDAGGFGGGRADTGAGSTRDAAADESGDERDETWKRSEIVPHSSKIKVGDDKELKFDGVQAHVKIDGFRARVLLDYYFYNPDPRQYEGTFKVRLPSGGSPYFLGFGASSFQIGPDEGPMFEDSETIRDQGFTAGAIMNDRKDQWVEPKEAKVVPKERAARAYKQEVTEQVDPALAEWAGPGVFNARVFPIRPNDLHRVVFGYDVNLTRVGDTLEYRFPVPRGVPTSKIDIEVERASGMDVQFEPETDAAPGPQKTYAHYEYESPSENKVAKVRIQNAGTAALTGSHPETGSYFATRFRPQLQETKAANPTERAVFVVDTSMSSNPDRFNIWRKLLRATLANNRGQLEEFAVVFFNVETFWWRQGFVSNTENNVESLMNYIDELALEGASDIGAALREASAPGWKPPKSAYDIFLLSDGNVTWGKEGQYALSEELTSGSGRHLFAYRTGLSGENTDLLRHLARETRGAVFSVVAVSLKKEASEAHTFRPWTIDDVKVEGAQDLLLAGRPETVFPGQSLTLVGRGGVQSGDSVELELKRRQEEKTVKTGIEHSVDSTLAPRAYGQIAVGQLEQFLGSTREAAQAYSRQFRVARKSSSLLMLEDEQSYRQYGIRPERDAELVESTRVGELVSQAIAELKSTLGEAKTAFLEWFEKLKGIRGVDLQPSQKFETFVHELPKEKFEVEAEPLQPESHRSKDVGSALKGQLEKRKPTYDVVMSDARRRQRELSADDALKALSSLVEANPGRAVVARDVGYTAMGWGQFGHAYRLFDKVARDRPFEPQTYHQAALTLDEANRPNLAMAYFELALSGQWDARFGSFRKIVHFDYLRFLRSTPDSEFTDEGVDLANQRRPVLREAVGLDRADLVVTVTWNTDATDVDLHVVEPSGEEVYYSHRRSNSTGARLTEDVTQGFGPEMYVLEDAPSGDYEIFAHYYGSNQNRSGTRTKVYATVYRNWGTEFESVQRKVVELENEKEETDIETVSVK